MEIRNALYQIARTLVDAFDVDIQLWMGKALKRLRDTAAGESFARWAEANPMAFEILLRVTSAAVRRLPQDSNLLVDTIYTQLSRLPVEVKRAVEADGVEITFRTTQKDDEFFAKYEDALKDLPDESLAEIAQLSRRQLKEWVNSPSRIRAHLLKKWAKETSEREERGERPRRPVKELLAPLASAARSVPAKLDSNAEKLAPSVGKVADWLEAHGGKRK
jgi:sulfite reductase alpha subunit-like flavoprotein